MGTVSGSQGLKGCCHVTAADLKGIGHDALASQRSGMTGRSQKPKISPSYQHVIPGNQSRAPFIATRIICEGTATSSAAHFP